MGHGMKKKKLIITTIKKSLNVFFQSYKYKVNIKYFNSNRFSES